MELKLSVREIGERLSGTGAKGEWVKQSIIFDEIKDQYANSICIDFWGDKANETASLAVGEIVTVSVNIESKNHNGRWFTNIRAWKLERAQQGATQQAYQQQNFSGGHYQQHGGYPQHQYQQPQQQAQPQQPYQHPQGAPTYGQGGTVTTNYNQGAAYPQQPQQGQQQAMGGYGGADEDGLPF